MAFDNNVFITGNLTRDPELRFTPQGTAVCHFGVAWNQRNKDGEDKAHYFDCSAWRDLAENIAESCKKGDRVNIHGRLDFRTWESDGKTHSKVEITVEDMGPSARWATTTQTKKRKADVPTAEKVPEEEPF